MVYEVEFSLLQEGNFELIHTAFIQAQNVTECKLSANQIADEKHMQQESLVIDIQELN